jgi:hypothetical protein
LMFCVHDSNRHHPQSKRGRRSHCCMRSPPRPELLRSNRRRLRLRPFPPVPSRGTQGHISNDSLAVPPDCPHVCCVRLLNLEAGGSLHLPKMMAINFSGEDPTRPSLQQDEGYNAFHRRSSSCCVTALSSGH